MFKKANIYVMLQLGFIFVILITAPIYSKIIFLLSIQILGFLLVAWSAFVMKIQNLRVSPEVKVGGVLVVNGPYHLIRHPMYLSVLLIMMPLVIDYFTYMRLAFMIGLFITLIMKLTFEEKLLMKSYADYKNYKAYTWRLIPYIY